MRFFSIFIIALSLVSCSKPVSAPEITTETHTNSNIDWKHQWDDSVFQTAKAQNKLIILSLEAIWCHWCHVMQAETYSNPQVEKLLRDNFVSVSIDQDSNSGLSNRYKNYGWPATILFNSQGQEIVKRAGYIEINEMIELLENKIKDPSPDKDFNRKINYSTISFLSNENKSTLENKYLNSLDTKKGGLKTAQKYINRDTVEYGLTLARTDDKDAQIAKQHSLLTLKAALALLDPAWGGFYQYSTHYDWQSPHYEKLAKTQAEYLRIYSLAQLQEPNKEFATAIDQTIKYIDKFFTSPNNSFYTSQDADLVQGQKATDYFSLNDKARRTKGIPRIDKNIYADKNGRIIEALALAYRVKQDPKILERAVKAIESINQSHRNQVGSYSHASQGASFLSDNLFMARALLALYETTAKPEYLLQAQATTQYIIENHRGEEPGYLSDNKTTRIRNAQLNSILKPVPLLDENIKLARFFNKISHYLGDEAIKDQAKYIMLYLASDNIIETGPSEPGILLLNNELADDPIHFTIVGSKKDKTAKALFEIALTYPSDYIRVEWYDSKEAKLINHDVDYPELPKAAAFSCVNHACSLPVYDVKEFAASINTSE